ncbi:hypothetical protein ABL78_7434 [Leptomonas seymouri]|uniref:Uncharacterized protein n=1 Tax=Leptomonas seymouri TaxID=5684 RepID=A0A0N1P9I9_LEPSE|nr:hypothetical protein ABL78_7434 [Leptomonas seymouri]|eukprot:KPI83535.1 hypothetical protein ABL78_7434 [Leptomonas seymouri]
MSAELECGSETVGRYTCRYAPRPSVCCANGCCAIHPSSGAARKPMEIWVRVVIALSVAVGMVLVFLLLKYRDQRGLRAYQRLCEHRRAQAAEELQRLRRQQQQHTSQEMGAVPRAFAVERVPTEQPLREG